MDTRTKILAANRVPGVLADGEWLAIAGVFDPLTVVQARRIAGFRRNARKLMAVVLQDEDALFAAEARAALIAGLREVDAVLIAPPERWRTLVPKNARVEIVEDIAGERARSADFVQFVLQRQNA
jgi:hypothetical protein